MCGVEFFTSSQKDKKHWLALVGGVHENRSENRADCIARLDRFCRGRCRKNTRATSVRRAAVEASNLSYIRGHTGTNETRRVSRDLSRVPLLPFTA
jgi:hypothetical protein